MLVVKLTIISFIFELILYISPHFWRFRKQIAYINCLFIVTSTVFFGIEQQLIFSLIFIIINTLRVGNMFRIIKARMHPAYLLRVTKRTSFWLGVVLTLSLVITYGTYGLSGDTILILIGLTQALIGLGLVSFTISNIHQSRFVASNKQYDNQELPTVSVLIPARNETEDLEECLQAILKSDYPKLEILVFDDCSYDRTPEVIRSFAHDGVRFIKGSEPREHWLAKNEAYQALAEQASGKLLLFCGVDTRFDTNSIRSLVMSMISSNQAMVSVMPRRVKDSMKASIIQPMRYWWELVIPRSFIGRPPVLSSCWLIQASTLKKIGRFKAVSQSVLPESYIAKTLKKQNSYSFIRSSTELGITSYKTFDDQLETAIRVRYPQIHRRPELSLVIIFTSLFFLLGPFFLAIAAIVEANSGLLTLSLIAILCGVITHVSIVYVSNPKNTFIAIFDYPLVLISELCLGFMSMYEYEFSTVIWKERNICIPVMHTTPHIVIDKLS